MPQAWLEVGKTYTVLLEWRNVTVSGSADMYYSESASRQMSAISSTYITTSSGSVYKTTTCLHASDDDGVTRFFWWRTRLAANSSLTGEFRLSIYPGEYTGPYKPYAGVQLYATQAELDVQADKISLVVDGTSTSSSLVLTDKAINAVTDNLTIKGSDGTTTVISGGEVQANSIKADDLNVTNINASNSLTIGALSTATQADVLNSNVQVGGRNLLRKTSSFSNTEWKRQRTTVVDGRTIKLTPTTGSAYAKYKVNYLDYSEHSSGDYTLSFEYRVADDATSYTSTQLVAYVGFNVSGRDDEIFDTSYDNYLNTAVSTDITSTWTKCVVTVGIPLGLTSGTTAALVTGSNLTVQFGSLGSKKPTLIRNIKLEKGTRATDWTPAPEDVDAGISSAAQTATNYIVADSSGIKIADSDPANATTFLHLASTFLDFVRGGSSMLKAWVDGAVAKVRVGAESGFNTLTDNEGIKLRNGTTVLGQFATNLIELGKNSTSAVIKLCGGVGKIEYDPTYNNGTLFISNSGGTSQGTTIFAGDGSTYAHVGAHKSMASMAGSELLFQGDYVTLIDLGDTIGEYQMPVADVLAVLTSVPVDLYDNDSASASAAATLSESAANFRRLTIMYRDTDGNYSSVDVWSPNGKRVALSLTWINGATTQEMYQRVRWVTISGTTISTSQLNSGEKYRTGQVKLGATASVTNSDYIAITHVIGYR